MIELRLLETEVPIDQNAAYSHRVLQYRQVAQKIGETEHGDEVYIAGTDWQDVPIVPAAASSD